MSSPLRAMIPIPTAAGTPAAERPTRERPFRICEDRDRGLISVVGRGAWTAAIMDAHFDELGALLGAVRARGERIRVLVDLTQAAEQPAGVMARIGAGKARIYRIEDRVALVMSTSRGKLQMRGAHDAPNHGLFLSMNAAMTWLFAWG